MHQRFPTTNPPTSIGRTRGDLSSADRILVSTGHFTPTDCRCAQNAPTSLKCPTFTKASSAIALTIMPANPQFAIRNRQCPLPCQFPHPAQNTLPHERNRLRKTRAFPANTNPRTRKPRPGRSHRQSPSRRHLRLGYLRLSRQDALLFL